MASHHGRDIASLARRVYAALQQDNLVQAEEVLLRLVTIAPEAPAYAAQLATLYRRRGQHGLAIAFAQRAAALDPEDPHYARALGHALEAGGEPELAREAYLASVAVGSNPRHPEAWLALARLERAQGRLGTAEQYARQAIDVAPHTTEGYIELARVLRQDDHPREALAALARGLRLTPDDPELRALHDVVATASAAAEGFTATEGARPADPS